MGRLILRLIDTTGKGNEAMEKEKEAAILEDLEACKTELDVLGTVASMVVAAVGGDRKEIEKPFLEAKKFLLAAMTKLQAD